MKFSTDKKSSLFIYANDIIKGSDGKMENTLKKELEATKSALKLQTTRCRQLVAAFTRKLHEKELELRESNDLRDQQLSRLLRALLILESRLKKEQKIIRQQLQEKDLIIEKQEKEISKYKNEANRRWTMDSLENKTESNNWCLPEMEPSKTTGAERLDILCKGLLTNPSLYRTEVESGLEKNNEFNSETTIKKEENTFKDNPVLESVNQILLRDEEELLKSAQPVTISLNEKVMFNSGEDSAEWYETNSNPVSEEQTSSGAWCIKVEEGEEKPEVRGKKDIWIVEKTSPSKSQHLEEKACLEMSKKNLTVVDLEEIDSNNPPRAASPVKSTASYEEILPVTTNYKPIRNLQKPPALPPKPARLLKPYQILQQKNKDPRHQKDCAQPPADQAPRPPQNLNISKVTQPVPKKQTCNSLSQSSTNTRHRHSETKPESAEVKNRPKLPDPNLKPKKTQINGLSSSSLDSVNAVVPSPFAKQKKSEEPMPSCGTIKIGSSVSSLITGLSRDTIVTELNGESGTTGDDSHVSQLVRQFEVLGKLGMLDSDKAEDEVNDIRKNFEEFKLDESYVIEAEENGRLDGDGAENRNMVNYYASLTIVPPSISKEQSPGVELEYKMYETFLENTGLSQKSILTPSRMLSNHRSCLKPKDVKHRSRVKAAAAIEKCNVNTNNGGSTVKYWTEPFL